MNLKLFSLLICSVLAAFVANAQQHCEKAIERADSIMKLSNKTAEEIETAIEYYIFAENNCLAEKTRSSVISKKERAQKEKQAVLSGIPSDAAMLEAIAEFQNARPSSSPLESQGKKKQVVRRNLRIPANYFPLRDTLSPETLLANLTTFLSEVKITPGMGSDKERRNISEIEERLFGASFLTEPKIVFDSTASVINRSREISEDLMYLNLRSSLYHFWNFVSDTKWDPAKLDSSARVLEFAMNATLRKKFVPSPKSYLGLAGLENSISKYYETIGEQRNNAKHLLLAVNYCMLAFKADPSNPNIGRSLFTYIRNLTYVPYNHISEQLQQKFTAQSCLLSSFLKTNIADKLYPYLTDLECLQDQIVATRQDKVNGHVAATTLVRSAITNVESEPSISGNLKLFFKTTLYSKLVDIQRFYARDSTQSKLALQQVQSNLIATLQTPLSSQRMLTPVEEAFFEMIGAAERFYKPAERIAMYEQIIQAVERSDNDYLSIKSLSNIDATAYTNLGKVHLARKTATDSALALTYYGKAIETFEKIDYLKYYNGYSEEYQQFANMYFGAIGLSAAQGNSAMSKRLYDQMFKVFKNIFSLYNFDYYLMQNPIAASAAYGEMLFKKGRYKEAIAPLSYGSFEGMKNSTDRLVEIYSSKELFSQPLIDSFKIRTSYQSNGMKKFTVPITAGELKEVFDVYVSDRAIGHPWPGIQDQAKWIKDARGFDVAPVIIESFDKLQSLAWKNKVSFQDLCIYAVGSTKDSLPNSTSRPDSVTFAFNRHRHSVSKLLTNKTNATQYKYIGYYYEIRDWKRLDTLFDEMLLIDSSFDRKDYISYYYFMNGADAKTHRLFLSNSALLDEYSIGYRRLNRERSTVALANYVQLLNAVMIDSMRYRIKPSDSLRVTLAEEYNSLAWYGLLTSRTKDVVGYLEHSIKLDSASVFPYSNLPHAYLFNKEFAKAKAMYLDLKNKPFNKTFATYKDAFLADFKDFEKAGIMNDNVKEIAKLLEE